METSCLSNSSRLSELPGHLDAIICKVCGLTCIAALILLWFAISHLSATTVARVKCCLAGNPDAVLTLLSVEIVSW